MSIDTAAKNTLQIIKYKGNSDEVKQRTFMSIEKWKNKMEKSNRQQSITNKTAKDTEKKFQNTNKKPSQEQQHSLITTTNAWRDVLFYIFQYLKKHELLKAAQVCKMWRDVATHRSLWKNVRMENCKITDWESFANTLEKQDTQYLDLRNTWMADDCYFWETFVNAISRVKLVSLMKLELCKCPPVVVEVVSKRCPQLKILTAMSIECKVLNLESIGNLKQCQELRLRAEYQYHPARRVALSLQQDLTPLQELTQLTHLSLLSIKDLATNNIAIIQKLTNLEILELGECSKLPQNFGPNVLQKLKKLKRLRLEEIFISEIIVESISKLQNLSHVELVMSFIKLDVFKCFANCKNIKRLLITLDDSYSQCSPIFFHTILFPTVVESIKELSHTLTHFVFGISHIYIAQNKIEIFYNCIDRLAQEDSMSVIKPLPHINWIKNTEEEIQTDTDQDYTKRYTNKLEVDFTQLQKALSTALPNSRIILLKMRFLSRIWQPSIFAT